MLQRWLKRLVWVALMLVLIVLPAQFAHGPTIADASATRILQPAPSETASPAFLVTACVISAGLLSSLAYHRLHTRRHAHS